MSNEIIEVPINNESGRDAVKAIKEAIQAAGVVLFGPNLEGPRYVEVEVVTSAYSKVKGEGYADLGHGKFPLKKLGRKYATIGFDFSYDHGGFQKVELKGVTKVRVAAPGTGGMSADCWAITL